MPEFILNTQTERARKRSGRPAKPMSFDDLSEFARGYVEAMFFTNGDTGNEERENHLNELGTGRLTRAAVADVAADCGAFWTSNESDILSALALIPGKEGLEYARASLDDRRIGHLFWFARQGHGVGFTDDGYADCLERLQEAAREFGEAYCEVWRGWIYHR